MSKRRLTRARGGVIPRRNVPFTENQRRIILQHLGEIPFQPCSGPACEREATQDECQECVWLQIQDMANVFCGQALALVEIEEEVAENSEGKKVKELPEKDPYGIYSPTVASIEAPLKEIPADSKKLLSLLSSTVVREAIRHESIANPQYQIVFDANLFIRHLEFLVKLDVSATASRAPKGKTDLPLSHLAANLGRLWLAVKGRAPTRSNSKYRGPGNQGEFHLLLKAVLDPVSAMGIDGAQPLWHYSAADTGRAVREEIERQKRGDNGHGIRFMLWQKTP